MTTQQDVYEGKQEVTSGPFGLTRNNRNHAKKLAIIMDTTHADPGDAVLEVGCGHGIHAEQYARRFWYTGVDISTTLCAETRSRVKAVSPQARVDVADAMRLPYADDTFDAVVGTAVLHHLADQVDALQEWGRVTKAGGSVTLVEPNYMFPLAFATTHLLPEERHKAGMAPWRVRETIRQAPGEWSVEPCIYTPPWPERLAPLYDTIDELATRAPGARWASQLLRIHGRV